MARARTEALIGRSALMNESLVAARPIATMVEKIFSDYPRGPRNGFFRRWLFAISDARAITPALPVAFVFARRRRPIALLSLPARPSPCRSPALVAAIALSCPPGMKTLLASFQQTA